MSRQARVERRAAERRAARLGDADPRHVEDRRDTARRTDPPLTGDDLDRALDAARVDHDRRRAERRRGDRRR